MPDDQYRATTNRRTCTPEHSALAASLLCSIFRLGWHLPLLLYGAITWADALLIVAMQIVVTWLYNSTRGSVLIVMVLHFMQNVVGGIFNPAFSSEDAADYAWLRAALYATIAIGVIAWAGAAHLSRRSVVK